MHNFLNLFSLRNADFFRGYIAKSQKSKFFSSTVKWAVAHSVERDLLPTKYLLWINNYFLNSVQNCYNLGLLLLSHKKRIYLVSDGWISCIVYFSLKKPKAFITYSCLQKFPAYLELSVARTKLFFKFEQTKTLSCIISCYVENFCYSGMVELFKPCKIR